MRVADLQIMGAFYLSFARSCINLRVLTGEQTGLLESVDPNGWYPAEDFLRLYRLVTEKYKDPGPIQEQIGSEMMKLWYEFGPGKTIVKKGVDFLEFQTGSAGYRSVVRGPEDVVGGFSLERLDVKEGIAVVRSSTPFDRNMERGILHAGLRVTGDLVYVDVKNEPDPNVFEIRFH